MFLPCQFSGITGNTGNHKNDRKIPKSDQTLNQTTRDINKFCLGEILLQKLVRIKFYLETRFLNVLYGKKNKNLAILEINSFLNQKINIANRPSY